MPKMKKDDRVLDICAFLHRLYITEGKRVTTGEYAKSAHLSNSPYLRSVFTELLDVGIVTIETEPYKATHRFTFALDYDNIEERGLERFKDAIIRKVGVWQDKLL